MQALPCSLNCADAGTWWKPRDAMIVAAPVANAMMAAATMVLRAPPPRFVATSGRCLCVFCKRSERVARVARARGTAQRQMGVRASGIASPRNYKNEHCTELQFGPPLFARGQLLLDVVANN
jgi:hypothetical protein